MTRLVPNLHWQASYDPRDVEQFLRDADAECAHLRSQIEGAKERKVRAKAADARRSSAAAEVEARIRTARQDMGTEEEHRGHLEAIRAQAAEEAARVVATAQREADAMRVAASLLASRLSDRDEAGASRVRSGQTSTTRRAGGESHVE